VIPAGEAPPAPDASLRPRRRRLGRILVVLALVVVLAVVVSSMITLQEFAIVPGTARDVGPLIGVGGVTTPRHQGAVLLTDVDLVQLRAIDWLAYRLNTDATLVPATGVTGGESVSTYDAQGAIDMASAQQAASVAALHVLGYPVVAKGSGVAIYAIGSHSALTGHAAVGEVITAIDDTPVTTLASLSSILARATPGEEVTLTLTKMSGATSRHATLTLGVARRGANGALDCLPAGATSAEPLYVAGRRQACLGAYLQQLWRSSGVSVRLDLSSEGIIGPSAGLAFALWIVEKLDRADLTGGRRIAATGTMSIDGSVGDVGGVAQKTVAVERTGASLFFVPSVELKTARAHASASLRVVGVDTLAQAIAVLERLGGSIARPPSP
jgi:Lon-like protease